MFEGRNNWLLRYPFVMLFAGLSCIFLGAVLHGLDLTKGIVIPGTIVAVGIVAMAISIMLDSYKWVCSKCGRESLTADKYCTRCGGLMILKKKKVKKCPNGHPVHEYDRFCPKCGEKVR